MPFEHSAGAVVFYQGPKGPEFLLLRYERNKRVWWDYPKGKIEKGEKNIETMRREVKEETGLEKIKVIEGFKTWIKWFFRQEGKTIFKIVDFYLVESPTKNIKLSREHTGYLWLPYEAALKRLTHKNAKMILEKARKFLRKQRA